MKTLGINKLILYAFMIVLLAVFIIPLFYVFNTSLKSELDFVKDPVNLVTQIHFENFVNAWKQAHFSVYVFNSLFYVTVVVVVSLIMAIFLAFPLARGFFKLTGFIYALFLAGLFLPNGIIPLFQMLLWANLYDTRTGYLLTLVSGGGVPLFFFISYIKGISKEFDEAASIDGCGYINYIFKILIPLIAPAISSMAILSAISVWNEIINSIIFLSSDKLFPITRGLYVFKGQYSVSWPLLTAALIIVALPLVILYIFLQRYIIDGVVAGGIKS